MSSLISQELQGRIEDQGSPISFAEFMRIALYHPEEGYYRRPRKRVGFGGTTDFFTATSTGAVFGELVQDACASLMGAAELPKFSFVEIGAEPNGGILPADNRFRETRLFQLGAPLDIPTQSVVFANELFDAQPFHRLIFTRGKWREIGVDWKNGLSEQLLPDLSEPVDRIRDLLPKETLEGYQLDISLAAEDLLETLLSLNHWNGLLVIFDYGKSWRELIEATPQGTARAYRRHRQSNDLLADPGEQDLTGHVCWDRLTDVLRGNRFDQISLQSQESFFIKQAQKAIESIVSDRPGQLDPRRQELHQLLHPANMGQKFQVLHARRNLT